MAKPTLIPVPIPIYVPVPMAMYNIPVPYPVPLPIPVPVPCFIPTSRKSADGILKQIKVRLIDVVSVQIIPDVLLFAEHFVHLVKAWLWRSVAHCSSFPDPI